LKRQVSLPDTAAVRESSSKAVVILAALKTLFEAQNQGAAHNSRATPGAAGEEGT
jgi:hypothetical protein